MKPPVVIIGLGEIGGVFARALLRAGHPVVPVVRGDDPAACAAAVTAPRMAVVAVGESDLAATLASLPAPWKDRVVLLQNELLPADWEPYGFRAPTVISLWFEKKKGQDVKVLLPSPALGPYAETLRDALARVDVPVRVLDSAEALLHELVLKNLYILTTNIAGLEVGGTVSELWTGHNELARAVAADVIRLQKALTGQPFDDRRLIDGMLEAFAADPDHRCMGRSAPARLQRALALAQQHGVAVPALDAIARTQG